MAKMNPFAKFEKSGKDKEPKGMKEGSKKEEAFDKKQMRFAAGGRILQSAVGGDFHADKIVDRPYDTAAAKKAGLSQSTTLPSFAKGEKTGLGHASTSRKGGTGAAPKGYARGGMVIVKGSAPASRTVREADGIAQRGKTRGTQFAQK
jgi:hypothetical protein